jgi:hypothetical protein
VTQSDAKVTQNASRNAFNADDSASFEHQARNLSGDQPDLHPSTDSVVGAETKNPARIFGEPEELRYPVTFKQVGCGILNRLDRFVNKNLVMLTC